MAMDPDDRARSSAARGQLDRSGASWPPELCVFDPSTILTITIERAASGDEVHVHPGGQGFWISRMARQLGATVRLVTALGGESGRYLEPLIAGEGIELCYTEVVGDNGAYVHDRRSGTRTVIAEAAPHPLTRHEADDLYGATLAASVGRSVVVLSGPRTTDVFPADWYGRLAADLASLGLTVIADLSGAAMHGAVDGGVDILKVSEDDLRRDGFLTGDARADLLGAISRLHDAGARAVVLTRADQPSLALADDGVVAVTCPTLRAIDHRGAGDAMTAALAAAVGAGSSFDDALRLGAAAGATAVTRRGLASGRRETVGALGRYVTIEPFGSLP